MTVKLPDEVANALETMKSHDMTNFAIICAMKSKDWAKENGCKEDSVLKANHTLYKYSFGNGAYNPDKVIEALVNGYVLEPIEVSFEEAIKASKKGKTVESWLDDERLPYHIHYPKSDELTDIELHKFELIGEEIDRLNEVKWIIR